MSAPPSGTLTFLFTDIEASTRLWEAHPLAMEAALARHDALLRAALEAQGGFVFKTVGDAFCAAFPTAGGALAAAHALQRGLAGESWDRFGPDFPVLRVRAALHSGSAQERDGDYFGPALNRCARLLALAHGGQVLLSLVTQELVRDELPEGLGLADLGEHRLKDLARPLRVYQLLAADLPADFPPLRSLDARPHNQPIQLTSFVGREREMSEVRALLGTWHLVTLTGMGGTGKTRLALQVAAELVDEFDGGVWFADLSSTQDGALVASAVAVAMGLREQPGQSIEATLLEHVGSRRLLLVLDNCEHVVASCARLADQLLRAAPNVRLLATTREALAIAGETTYALAPLATVDPAQLAALTAGSGPDAAAVPDVAAVLSQYEAVRLFIDRAVALRQDFQITNANAPAVAQICYRLDDIPLAIELAAARVRLLAVEEIDRRLADRFRLLTGGSGTAQRRQQTLEAAIDWSYDLLTEPERVLFRRLAVFRGGWTLEAAEAVGSDDPDREPEAARADDHVGEREALGADSHIEARGTVGADHNIGSGAAVEAADVLDLMQQLVDKSLVVVDVAAEGARFRYLETVRQYASGKLDASGERQAMSDRHLDWCQAFAQETAERVRGTERLPALLRFAEEHDNLLAALEWSKSSPGTFEQGQQLAADAQSYWTTRGHWTEGRRQLETFLALPGAPVDTAARAELCLAAATLLSNAFEDPGALPLAEEAVRIARARGDDVVLARALDVRGSIARGEGDYAAAAAYYEESLALYRRFGQLPPVAALLGNMGLVAKLGGDDASFHRLTEESLRICLQIGHTAPAAYALGNLAVDLLAKGAFDRALPLVGEGLALMRQMGDQRGITWLVSQRAYIALLHENDPAAGRRYFEECLAIWRAIEMTSFVPLGILQVARAAWAEGDLQAARDLYGQSIAESHGDGASVWRARAHADLVWMAVSTGDLAAAKHHLIEGAAQLEARRDGRAVAELAALLDGCAMVSTAQGQPQAAARRLAAVAAWPGAPEMHPWNRRQHEEALQSARSALDPETFDRTWEAGSALTLEEALAEALAEAVAEAGGQALEEAVAETEALAEAVADED